MKKLNKLFGFAVLSASALTLMTNVNAADDYYTDMSPAGGVCTVNDTHGNSEKNYDKQLESCIHEPNVTTIEFNQTSATITLKNDHDIDGFKVKVAANTELVIDGNVNFTGVTSKAARNIELDAATSKLTINGSLNMTGKADNLAIFVNGSYASTITVAKDASLTIDGFTQGAIGGNANVVVNGAVELVNNGYGTNGAGITVSKTGSIKANNNTLGLLSQIKTDDGAFVEANDNAIIGMVLQDGSEIKEGADVHAYGNGDGETATEREADIAIWGSVDVEEGASLNAGTVAAYVDQGSHSAESATITGAGDINASLNPNVGLNNTISVNGDVFITASGNISTLPEPSEGYKYVVTSTGKISLNNDTKHAVTVYPKDSNEGITIARNETESVETVVVSVNGVKYIIGKGQSLSNLTSLSAIKNGKVGNFIGEDGTVVAEDAAIDKDVTLVFSATGDAPVVDDPTNPENPGRDPEAGEKPGDEENPQTGDNVVGSIAMGIAGLVGIVGSALVFDKKTNYNN